MANEIHGVAQALAAFDAAVAETRALVETLTESQLRVQPEGETWNVALIVGHLGTALTFANDTILLGYEGGAFPADAFLILREILNSSRELGLEPLLEAFDEAASRLRTTVSDQGDEELLTHFTVTMPNGNVRETSGAKVIEGAVDHLAEHRAQIADWLARA